MARYTKTSDGKYLIAGHKYEKLIGTRAQVWHGTAYKTSGELKKGDLMMNKHGRIVSKDKHFTEKKMKRLIKAGYGTRKGKFGAVKIGKSKKMRGGMAYGGPLSPHSYDGQGVGTSGVDLQIIAGQHGGRRRRTRRHRGGSPYGNSFEPAHVSGMKGTTPLTDSNAVQFKAGMSS